MSEIITGNSYFVTTCTQCATMMIFGDARRPKRVTARGMPKRSSRAQRACRRTSISPKTCGSLARRKSIDGFGPKMWPRQMIRYWMGRARPG